MFKNGFAREILTIFFNKLIACLIFCIKKIPTSAVCYKRTCSKISPLPRFLSISEYLELHITIFKDRPRPSPNPPLPLLTLMYRTCCITDLLRSCRNLMKQVPHSCITIIIVFLEK